MRFTRPAIRDWKTLWRELLVTFVGVLLALVVSAWWTGRQDRARERAYMRQITADIDRSLATSNLPAAIAAESKAARANVALLRAFRAPAPPPADSIARWLYDAEDYKAFTPFTGTARAMLSTGDINLIHNDSVRAIIVAWLGRWTS